jgi:hypothetical protein
MIDVPVSQYMGVVCLMLSSAFGAGTSAVGRDAQHNKGTTQILATIAKTMGWFTEMPLANWGVEEYAKEHITSKSPQVLPILTLNQIVGRCNRSQRSLSLCDSSQGPNERDKHPLEDQILSKLQNCLNASQNTSSQPSETIFVSAALQDDPEVRM